MQEVLDELYPMQQKQLDDLQTMPFRIDLVLLFFILAALMLFSDVVMTFYRIYF